PNAVPSAPDFSPLAPVAAAFGESGAGAGSGSGSGAERVPASAAEIPAHLLPPIPHSYGPLELPPRMLPRVKFWVRIYAYIFSWEYAVHDTHFPQLTYSIFDTKGKPRGALAAEKARVLAVLVSLKKKAPLLLDGRLTVAKLSAEEARIYKLFEGEGLLSEIGGAAYEKRIRGQAGMRDALEDAIFVSGRYLPRMEKVFERFGLPVEIAYLPFVESGFNKRAVSKVGASGIWQFMPYTGKLYLRVDDVVDERNDPMRAAEAAARLMSQNHAMLEEWPLAITAYNHGPMGIARGVKEVGSRELPDLIERYEGKSFGFASQNFYACLLAAMHVAKNSGIYLGEIPRARKLEFDEFVMPHFMELSVFLAKTGIDEASFRELNMALTKEVYEGRKYMPVGYTVRVPTEYREEFLSRYEAIPSAEKHTAQKGGAMFGPPAPGDVDPDLE
ncbi:MAG: lytic transglycosylase domain-containing protein, partial [Proteobacteria bacterium]